MHRPGAPLRDQTATSTDDPSAGGVDGGIATLESLRTHLQWAIELEHTTIPSYPDLLAVAIPTMFTLKDDAELLMALPVDDGGATAGPSFEYVDPAERDPESVTLLRNAVDLGSAPVDSSPAHGHAEAPRR